MKLAGGKAVKLRRHWLVYCVEGTLVREPASVAEPWPRMPFLIANQVPRASRAR